MVGCFLNLYKMFLCQYFWANILFTIEYREHNKCSLSVGHYELCRDDIGDLPGSPEHLWLRENANEIG